MFKEAEADQASTATPVADVAQVTVAVVENDKENQQTEPKEGGDEAAPKEEEDLAFGPKKKKKPKVKFDDDQNVEIEVG